ncbi:MAG: glutamine amidotransferase, partial [Acidimicrobiia bacterium]
RCLDIEDLVESTEGFRATRIDDEFIPDLDIASLPPILGYNKTMTREGAIVHITVTETGDPLVASMRHGRGATLAYTSDPAPHWGCNFVQWDQYSAFWVGCLEHLLSL